MYSLYGHVVVMSSHTVAYERKMTSCANEEHRRPYFYPSAFELRRRALPAYPSDGAFGLAGGMISAMRAARSGNVGCCLTGLSWYQ